MKLLYVISNLPYLTGDLLLSAADEFRKFVKK